MPNEAFVTYLQRDQESDGLNGVVTSIHVISHEEIVGVGAFASNAKEFHEVVELTVDVATNRDRTLDLLHIGLLG